MNKPVQEHASACFGMLRHDPARCSASVHLVQLVENGLSLLPQRILQPKPVRHKHNITQQCQDLLSGTRPVIVTVRVCVLCQFAKVAAAEVDIDQI